MKAVRLFLALALLSLPLTGCWDRIEIEERAVVLAISIDAAGSEAKKREDKITHLEEKDLPQDGMVHLTAQVAVPGRIPLGPSGGSGGKNESPVWVLESYGHTIDDAVKVLQQEIASQLFFGHLRVIVISEEYARRGLENLNDYLRRNPEVRRLAWMVVSRGKATDYMKTKPQLERVPALYLLSTLDHAVQMGKYPNEFLGNFWIKESSKGREGNLPVVEIRKNDNIQIDGLGYFRSEQLVGVTEPLEIALYMSITGIEKGGFSGYIPLPNSKESVMYRETHRKAETTIRLKNGRPAVSIVVDIEGNITEKSAEHATPVDNNQIIRELERTISKNAELLYGKFISKLQRDGSDIFGFGEQVRAKLPQYWDREIQTTERWSEVFRTMDVEVRANIAIRRVGMKAK